jgi:excisionase family DNA binding protein
MNEPGYITRTVSCGIHITTVPWCWPPRERRIERSSPRPEAPTPASDVMTAGEAAGFLRLHEKTVQRLSRQGKIPGRKVGAVWRYSRKCLEGWIED